LVERKLIAKLISLVRTKILQPPWPLQKYIDFLHDGHYLCVQAIASVNTKMAGSGHPRANYWQNLAILEQKFVISLRAIQSHMHTQAL
jgi:hypothetical protein